MASAQLFWDIGTAYDMFVSLQVLHSPSDFAVRGAWAAGVRARLSAEVRELLAQSQIFFHVPMHWIYSLPEPKDGAAVLWTLGQIPPAERLPTLTFVPECYFDAAKIFQGVTARGNWSQKDQAALQAAYKCKGKKAPSSEELSTILNWWAHPSEFGERYLEALRAYQEVFFAEEEKRIRPALNKALSHARSLAKKMKRLDLLEELSQGVRLDPSAESGELVLAPSYWCTPLLFFGELSPKRRMILFGARPPDASLIPGELVPDGLLRALQALSDGTRLRIMQYLIEQPLTPAELARRLRLRAPTVIHHLNTLRLAGLVQLTLEEGKDTKSYAVRQEVVAAVFDSLQNFLNKGGDQTTND